MRASEIHEGTSYAVVGKNISRARVTVLSKQRRTNPTTPVYFRCRVEEGLVYTGWAKTPSGGLDTEYVGKGTEVLLVARDFVRPWTEELARRTERDSERHYISEVMSEMDVALNALGLSSAYIQLVQTQHGPIAVTVLGIEELRAVQDLLENGKENGDE